MTARHRFIVVLAGTLLVAFLAGRYSSATLAVMSRIANSTPTGPTKSTSVPLSGRLGKGVMETHGSFPSAPVLVVVLDGSDWLTCEDLGRQLRILHRRALAAEIPTMVWARAASQDMVATYLQRERLGSLPITPLRESSSILEGDDPVDTPAALLVRADGSVLSGVSHPAGARGVRPVSFAEELAWPERAP